MTINEIRPDAARQSGAGPVQGSEAQKAAPVGRTAGASRADRVEISAEGRALAAGKGEPLSPERIAEIRQRIAEGAYDEPAVAEAVALRLLESGDLDPSA